MQSLESYLVWRGHVVTKDLADKYSVLLVNSWQTEYDDLLIAIRCNPSVRIVHRVDGSSQDYRGTDKGDTRQSLINQLADRTIFQSAYSRHVTREAYRVISHDGPIIHNPVDVDRFSPQGPAVDLPGYPPRIVYVTFSTNPLKGWREVYLLAEQNPDLTFILIGQYENPPSHPNLHIVGQIAHTELPAYLRSCDVFLALQQKEACPNVVLEAMACGLLILFADSGGTPEIVGDCGAVLESPEVFRNRLQTMMSNRELLSRMSRARALAKFAPDIVFGMYEREFDQVIRERPYLKHFLRWVWAWLALIVRPIRSRISGLWLNDLINRIRRAVLQG